MSKHTPEPWALNSHGRISAQRAHQQEYVATVYSLRDEDGALKYSDECEANAARIVACVNACGGLEDPDDYISRAEATRMALIRERDALRAERDGLRSALSAITDLYDTDEGCRSTPEYIAARAALGGRS